MSEEKETAYHSLAHNITPIYSTELIDQLNDDPMEEGFGQIIHLELFPNGEFLINDVIGRTLYRFNKNGKQLSKFRRNGRGPGEFLSYNIKYDGQHDLMGIYDPLLSRTTIMDGDMMDVINTFDTNKPSGYTIEILGFDSDGVFFKGFEGYNLQNYDKIRDLKIFYQIFDDSNLIPIHSLPLTDFHSTVNLEAKSLFLNYIPFGRRISLRQHNKQFIFISNSGFGFSVVDQTGTTLFSDTLSTVSIKPYHINKNQIDRHFELYYNNLEDKVKTEIIQDLRSQIDDNKPLWFRNSFIDMNGRLWFELYPEFFDDGSRWIVWETLNDIVYQVFFEEYDVRPQNANDDRVIAFKKNEFGLETVQIYRFYNE